MGHSPLVVRNLSVAYQKKPVLFDVSFEVPEGKLIGIIGPNGAGKSTLIKAVLGLIPKLRGEVLVYGKPYSNSYSRLDMYRSGSRWIGIFRRMPWMWL